MTRTQRDFQRLIKSANIPGTPGAPARFNAQQQERWNKNQQTLSQPSTPNIFDRAVMGVGNYADKLVDAKDQRVERGYYGRTRASTGLGKIPAALIDTAAAPVDYIRNSAIKGLQSFGNAGNTFWNGSDGKSENLLWRTGASAVDSAKNLWDRSSVSWDGKSINKPTTPTPNADPNLWNDWKSALGQFRSGALDTSSVVGLGWGGVGRVGKNLAYNVANEGIQKAIDYTNRPIEISSEAASTPAATNAWNNQPFDPTSWANAFGSLASLFPQANQQQAGMMPDPYYYTNTAVGRAARGIN